MTEPGLLAPTPAAEAFELPETATPHGPPATYRRPPLTSPPHRPPGALQSVQSLLYVLAISLFVITFIAQPIRIPSESMEPTLLVGDFLLMDKQVIAGSVHGPLPPAEIRHGDIIVFHEPVDDPAVHLVKRVIGIPGDRIHLRNGVVFRNDQPLTEPYAVYRKSAADPYRDNFPNLQMMDARVNANWWIRLRTLTHNGEVTVPPNSYFVMGDNRNDSEDSRYWGFVPRNSIVGRPLIVYFSVRQPDATVDATPSSTKPTLSHDHFAFARWDRMFRIVR